MKNPFIQQKFNVNKIYGKDTKIIFLIFISSSFSIILFILGLFTLLGLTGFPENILSWVDFIVLGILSCIGPIGFYNHLITKKKREIENQLPDFLREISGSTASGMTVFDAIKSAAKGDHGKLTLELQRMSSQLSWGISVNDVFDNFGKRMKSDLVKRMVITIKKALEIGGNTSSVFNAAAVEIDQAKRVEEQRKIEMSLYSIVIFISFFVFLAVILIIDKTIFAAIFDLQAQMAGQTIGNMMIASIDHDLLKYMFFSFVLVQSMGGGLLGGFMMDGKLSSGIRFGFVLILISFFVFKFLF